ncbi:IclR family transcriptional regulator [Arthrobacter sp. zg-Y238]|uniref:IclR family transcriptional regulator n=1 Tax=Arthrobacter sp. zg-Y238 TaxID=2964614 RepID=UPI002102BB2B|nr:IclR family transcriptional regulator [Arthrobacter sp. zg-Y238]MCQ1954721.1 IclR family transcriptional regulator [Arthrobacter sp. zg-Y238]
MPAAYARVQVPAAAQVLAILRYLGQQAGPVSASAVARDLSLPRSTTYHLLAALVSDGFAVHLPEERRYALGATAHELGTGYARQAPLQRIARFPLRGLVARTRFTAHLAVLQGTDVIYVIEERAPRQQPLVTDAGIRLPAHRTASGRVLLAGMTGAQLRALYPDPGAVRSSRSSGAGLPGLLEEIRGRGYAWEENEVTEGFSSIAVPVPDRSGHTVAGLTLTAPNRAPAAGIEAAPAHRIEAMADRVLPDLLRCAAELSRRLGARPRPAPNVSDMPDNHPGPAAP